MGKRGPGALTSPPPQPRKGEGAPDSGGERAPKAQYLLALLLTLFVFSLPARADDKPKAVLVLMSGVTLDDLKPGGKLPALRQLAERGSIALLHNRVWGDFNENAAYLSVGSSERMAAPEDTNATPDEMRAYQPPVANRANKYGALGRAMATAKVGVDGTSNIPAWLVAADPDSKVPFPRYKNYSLYIEKLSDNVIRTGKVNEYFRYVVDHESYENRTFYICVPYTLEIQYGTPYRRLGFLIAVGPGIEPGTLLTSPTTRTPGLVANVDIAPTIADLYGTAIPGAAGQPVRSVESRDAWGTLDALDRQTNAAARATTPVLAGYGIFAGVCCLFALAVLRTEPQKWQTAARFALLTAASVLPALLAVGVIAPQTPLRYGATLAAIAIAIASVSHFVAPRSGTLPLNLVLYGLIATIIADAFLHLNLLERSLLSASTLTGIRFYGIGNEWFGLLLGAALACAAPWWLGVLVICAVGLPYFGADAGGTLAATAAFAVLFFARQKSGLKRRHFAAAFTLAIGVTMIFALLDRLQPDASRPHVGAAVATGQTTSGFGALTELALRKVAMNTSLFLSPWTLITIIAMLVIGFGLRQMVITTLPSNSELRSTVAPAAISGAIIAFLFNDGGVAAGLLIMVPILVRFLDALLMREVEREHSG
ncbi:MAG: hypothetical protein H8F28_23975 [Fibrella sp.]|nr:hypothetical protein [Armatimonadota bacterium]